MIQSNYSDERTQMYLYIELSNGRLFVIGSRRRALEALALDLADEARR